MSLSFIKKIWHQTFMEDGSSYKEYQNLLENVEKVKI